MITALSTKKLHPAQRKILSGDDFKLTEYDAIHIQLLDFEVANDYDYYIFTSKNAVRAFLKAEISPRPCFCVGDKTRRFLEENGLEVIRSAPNSQELANLIRKGYKTGTFLFLRGSRARRELPDLLETSSLQLDEVEVYHTSLVQTTFSTTFDSVLFFSPSAVQSFASSNHIGNAWAICIGKTTAEEAFKHTSRVMVAKAPTVEATLTQLKELKIVEEREDSRTKPQI